MKTDMLTGIVLLLMLHVSCYKEPKGSDEDKNVIVFMDTLGHYWQEPLIYPASVTLDIDADSIADVTIASWSDFHSYHSGSYAWQTVTPLNNAFVAYRIGKDTTWKICMFPPPVYYDTCWYYNTFELVRSFNNFDTVHAMRYLSNEMICISNLRNPGVYGTPESGYTRLAFKGIGYLFIQTAKTYAWLKIEVMNPYFLVVHKCCYGLQPPFIIKE